MNRDAMVVTALVSHVDRSGLNDADTWSPTLSDAKYDKSVMPVVQDVESSASVPAAPRSAFRPALSLLVYVTPPRMNVPPTGTPGHMTVTPFDPR